MLRRLAAAAAALLAVLLWASASFAACTPTTTPNTSGVTANSQLELLELICGGGSYAHIASNTTTTVKFGAGVLQSITINTKGASANVATVYDNTAGSGTVIAVIDTTAGVVSLPFNVNFSTGLTIVTATGTAPDITVA